MSEAVTTEAVDVGRRMYRLGSMVGGAPVESHPERVCGTVSDLGPRSIVVVFDDGMRRRVHHNRLPELFFVDWDENPAKGLG